jgi:recombination associated protein RdgC
MFFMSRALPDDAVERFAQHAAPPIDTVRDTARRGWVTGRHLLDRNITEESAYYGGYLRLTLQEAERKIPKTLLKAEQTMEELAVLAAEGREFLNRRQKSEIKKQVEERLMPTMPPQVKGFPFVYKPGQRLMLATASSPKQCDVFSAMFQSTMGYPLLPFTPDIIPLERTNTDVREWKPSSFSPEMPDETMETQPGREFLTWLWYLTEEREGRLDLNGETVNILLDGPLTFAHEGGGAHVIGLRGGAPTGSTEANACLRCGKKLKQAKLTLAKDDEIWSGNVGADEFVIRSLSLPASEELLDPISRFQERMIKLEDFCEMFLELYDQFVKERSEPTRWHETQKAIHRWVKTRTGRA